MRTRSATILLVLAALAAPLHAQTDGWRHKWYWGAHAGAMTFNTPTGTGTQTGTLVGGHWLVTGTRSALYAAIDEVIYSTGTSSAVADTSSAGGLRSVTFTGGRRLQAQVFMLPLDGEMQLYLGGGFGIHQVLDATPSGTFSTPANQTAVLQNIQAAGTRAFPLFSAGVQYNMGKMGLFGQYQFVPTGRNYLLNGVQHVFSGGIRYAVSGSREEVTIEH